MKSIVNEIKNDKENSNICLSEKEVEQGAERKTRE